MIMQDDRFSRLERLMQSFGGSVPQYCYENGIRTVVIVANEIDFFDNAEAIVLSFISFKLVKFSIVSQKAFEVQSIYPTIYSNLVFKELSEEDYKDCDLFLFLSGVSETEIEQKLQLKKIAYCSMPKILTIASEWLFYYRPLAFFATTHPKVPVLVFKTPAFPPENLQSENEKKIWADRKERFVHTRRKIEQAIRLNYDIDLPSFKGLGYSNTELVKILTQPTGYMDGNGIRQLVDSDNEFVTITGGHRITLDQPSKAEHTIWLLGDCVVYGIGVGNRGTIASSLQKRLNNDCKITFKVENYGHNSLGMGECAFDILFTLPIKDGDIVIMNHDSKNYNSDCRFVHHIDSITWLYRPHNYEEVFIDKGHTNENGNRIIGDKLFEFLKDNQYFIGYDASKQITPYPYPVVYQNLFGLSKQQVGRSLSKDTTIELDNFKQSLKAYRDNIGAIVMNCNPFTLGHRYLIEMASKQVKRLYIFVVEENLSTFPFKDRIELVKQGTADLPNVTVLPSGKFIISQLTFVDYFNKSELQEKAIDPTFDVELFAQEIAPTLGINTRFAGEEPLDKLTKQYNDTMREVLPKYDISYIEIPRKELDDAPISASRVRKLMNEGRYDDLKKLVPATTYDYLLSLELP